MVRAGEGPDRTASGGTCRESLLVGRLGLVGSHVCAECGWREGTDQVHHARTRSRRSWRGASPGLSCRARRSWRRSKATIIRLSQRRVSYAAEGVPSARPFHPKVAEAQIIVDDMASLFLTKQASLSDVLKQGQELIAALERRVVRSAWYWLRMAGPYGPAIFYRCLCISPSLNPSPRCGERLGPQIFHRSHNLERGPGEGHFSLCSRASPDVKTFRL